MKRLIKCAVFFGISQISLAAEPSAICVSKVEKIVRSFYDLNVSSTNTNTVKSISAKATTIDTYFTQWDIDLYLKNSRINYALTTSGNQDDCLITNIGSCPYSDTLEPCFTRKLEQKLLTRATNIKFADATVSEALESLAKNYDLEIDYATAAMTVKISLDLPEVDLGNLLRYITELSGNQVCIRHGKIAIEVATQEGCKL